jgi:alkylated DNA repair dioxygenase AlkB
VLRQLDLFDAATGAPIAFDPAFRSLSRRELSDGAWVDYAPGWVSGHDALFDQLEQALPWRTERRRMYDRMVDTPRLLAGVPHDGIVEDMRRALSERYGEELVRTTAALYRDGGDSVAFHGDTTARDMDQALVATVSLGQPRRFLLKPTEGGASIAYELGRGDLIVMGGTCQRTWRHGIPKVARATGPRIALMFRPSWSADYDG